MIITKSAAELAAEQQAEMAVSRENSEAAQPVIIDALAKHVRHCWSTAKVHKEEIQARLIDSLRRRKGEYSPEKLQAIAQQGGSAIYMQLTAAKCTGAKAWLMDLFSPAGDKPWKLSSTPIPDLPPEISMMLLQEAYTGAMQHGVSPADAMGLVQKHKERLKQELKDESDIRAERMADYAEDILAEGKFADEFESFLDDLVTYQAAIFKGPVYRNRKKLKWVNMQGKHVPQLEKALVREFRRVSPFDFFPAPGAVDIGDSWCIERVRLSREELSAMRDVPGYHGPGIAQALLHYQTGGLREWLWSDDERRRFETGSSMGALEKDDLIDALEWSGKLQGQMLIEWGMEPSAVPDPLEEYPVSVMTIGNYTIRALVNPDPTGRSDYFKSCWRTLPGSFWGVSLPEDMADVADVCNSAARALVNNLAMASGPQVAIDMAQSIPGADYTSMHPWKIWAYDSSSTPPSGRAPVDFFSPGTNANELMTIYERFSRYADQVTGLPSYAFGSDNAAGAGRTASGLSMLMNAASKTIKAVVRDIDRHVLEPLVNKLVLHLMLDPAIPDEVKGDTQVRALGSDALVHKEAQQQRLIEMLNITANPIDQQIIGIDGRREMLEATFKASDLPIRDAVPSEEELMQRLMSVPQTQDPAGGVQGADGGPEQAPQ